MLDRQRSERKNTTCGLMLKELQEIWDEVGESEPERDSMLVEIENQCLEVYGRKLNEANKCRVKMIQEISKIRTEISRIHSALGDNSPHVVWKAVGGLKKELDGIVPQLQEMRKRKSERKSQLNEALNQLVKISHEIERSVDDDDLYKKIESETDLSLKLLQELRAQVAERHAEKRDRQKKVEDSLWNLRSLCLVLGMNFKHMIDEVNPKLNRCVGVDDISETTINDLTALVVRLSEIKMKRWEKIRNHATLLIELWNLMDVAIEEQKPFHNLTSNIAASASELTEPDFLSTEFLDHVEAEVSRLECLRSSKLNELIPKKRSELDNILRQAHVASEYPESESLDPELVLEQVGEQIARAKEEALSRRDLVERAEKWVVACQEECWLEDYNKDDKRFRPGRGVHLALKRAEKARATTNKIPATVEGLISRTTVWEAEHGVEFLYDGERLLNMLEQYNLSRREKDRERQRRREQKRLQGQIMTEKEVLYGTKPSPTSSAKKIGTIRRVSTKISTLQNRKPDRASKDEPASRRHQQCGCFVVPLSSSLYGDKTSQEETGSSPLDFLSPKASPPKADVENNTPQDKAMIIAERELRSPNSTPLKAIFVASFDGIKTPMTMPNPQPNTPPSMESSFEELRTSFVSSEYV